MRSQTIKDIEKEFLEPSFQYLVKNGLENTSVRDLCKAMGISYGSIYYWFEGKDDIYTSVVEYGIGKVATKLFNALFEKAHDPELFFNTFLNDIDNYIEELRLVFQFATSIEYGKVLRKKTEEFKDVYQKYIEELSAISGVSPEDMAPIIYMLISILVDYVVWQDRPVSEMQLKFLYKVMSGLRK